MINLQPESASREILWNLPNPVNSLVMYSLFAISMIVMLWGIWRRMELWSAGPDSLGRTNKPLKRLLLFFQYVVFQRGTNREKQPRLFHSLILWGFVVLLFTTTMVAIHHDLGIPIYVGRYYLAVTILSDVFGLGLLIGVGLAYHRRYVAKPDFLHSTRADSFMLLLLGALVIQGFCLEGLRIVVTDDPWRHYSMVGNLFAAFFWGLSTVALRWLHFGLWWLHAVSVFAFFALLPYTKFFHVLASSANLYLREINRPKGALSFPGDIEKLIEASAESGSDEFNIGVGSVKDLSWKTRLDLDSCTSCGRCQDVCPAYNSGKVLSPKWMILDTRNHLLALHQKQLLSTEPTIHKQGPTAALDHLDRSLLKSFLLDPLTDAMAENPAFRGQNSLVQQSVLHSGESEDTPLAGGLMEENVFWSCTSCRACMEVCPVGIEHVDLIMDVRRHSVLAEGKIPHEAQASLRAIESRGNPFGPAESRFDWAEGLQVPVLNEGDTVEVLYWVGCISAFDKRKQKIARAMVQILNASGLSWGVLGNRECCTGDPARRLGEENLFQTMAKQNLSTLSSVHFKTVVANCPHCFNSLQNEYPQVEAGRDQATPGKQSQFAGIEFLHHTHFIWRLIAEKRLRVDSDSGKTLDDITFHDPCYLGRYNDTYEEPREILVQLGAKPREMDQAREKSMCCGAGGGHFFMDIKAGERINVRRVNQAAEIDATTVATGCPFCLQMLEDGVKLTNRDGQMQVRDIAEFVAERLLAPERTTERTTEARHH